MTEFGGLSRHFSSRMKRMCSSHSSTDIMLANVGASYIDRLRSKVRRVKKTTRCEVKPEDDSLRYVRVCLWS